MAKVLVSFSMCSFEKEIYIDAENEDEADNYIQDNFDNLVSPEMNRIDYEILAEESEFDPPEVEETNPTT